MITQNISLRTVLRVFFPWGDFLLFCCCCIVVVVVVIVVVVAVFVCLYIASMYIASIWKANLARMPIHSLWSITLHRDSISAKAVHFCACRRVLFTLWSGLLTDKIAVLDRKCLCGDTKILTQSEYCNTFAHYDNSVWYLISSLTNTTCLNQANNFCRVSGRYGRVVFWQLVCAINRRVF